MRLQADQPVDDVHAGLLHLPGPGDVVRLVQPGLELHEYRHLLAVLGGARERPGDRTVGADAVEGLLDGEDVRIFRRFLDEAQHRIERFVRMVEQDVLLGEDGERGLRLSQRRRQRGQEGIHSQIRSRVQLRQGGGVRELQGAIHAVHVRGGELERGGERLLQRGRSTRVELEPDRGAPVPLPQLVLDRGEKVLGVLLVEVQVPVPGDPEGGGCLHRESRKEVPQVQLDDVLGHEICGAGALCRRNRHEAPEHRRDLDHRERQLGELLARSPAGLAPQHHRHVERLVPQMREGMSRVHRQRGEGGKHRLGEVGPRRHLGLVGEGRRAEDRHSSGPQDRDQVLPPDAVELVHHRVGALGDRGELLGGQHAVRLGLHHVADQLLLEPRHPHHEELV